MELLCGSGQLTVALASRGLATNAVDQVDSQVSVEAKRPNIKFHLLDFGIGRCGGCHLFPHTKNAGLYLFIWMLLALLLECCEFEVEQPHEPRKILREKRHYQGMPWGTNRREAVCALCLFAIQWGHFGRLRTRTVVETN